MLDSPAISEFSHVKPADTAWRSGGLRDFFLYRDLGVATRPAARVIAHLVQANEGARSGHGLAQPRPPSSTSC